MRPKPLPAPHVPGPGHAPVDVPGHDPRDDLVDPRPLGLLHWATQEEVAAEVARRAANAAADAAELARRRAAEAAAAAVPEAAAPADVPGHDLGHHLRFPHGFFGGWSQAPAFLGRLLLRTELRGGGEEGAWMRDAGILRRPLRSYRKRGVGHGYRLFLGGLLPAEDPRFRIDVPTVERWLRAAGGIDQHRPMIEYPGSLVCDSKDPFQKLLQIFACFMCVLFGVVCVHLFRYTDMNVHYSKEARTGQGQVNHTFEDSVRGYYLCWYQLLSWRRAMVDADNANRDPEDPDHAPDQNREFYYVLPGQLRGRPVQADRLGPRRPLWHASRPCRQVPWLGRRAGVLADSLGPKLGHAPSAPDLEPPLRVRRRRQLVRIGNRAHWSQSHWSCCSFPAFASNVVMDVMNTDRTACQTWLIPLEYHHIGHARCTGLCTRLDKFDSSVARCLL